MVGFAGRAVAAALFLGRALLEEKKKKIAKVEAKVAAGERGESSEVTVDKDKKMSEKNEGKRNWVWVRIGKFIFINTISITTIKLILQNHFLLCTNTSGG